MSKLNLQVVIDDEAGFCFGVIDAIHRAEESLDKYKRLYCLGEIVHNEEEAERLQKKGLILISHEKLKSIYNDRILIRAHGEPPETYEIIKKNNNEIIDASCKLILKIQKQIRSDYENGEFILIYGKHNHPEIIGLAGHTDNKAIVFEKFEELNLTILPNEITLYSQTTQSKEKYEEIKNKFIEYGFSVKTRDTICRQVSNRQPHLKQFCSKFDKILFVAGKNSSNGRVLFQICLNANPNSFFISTVKDVQSVWFKPGEKVGISGATSTPRWLMEEVFNIISKY